MNEEAMRSATPPRFTDLSQMPEFERMLDLLAKYCEATLPGRPSSSAGEQWVITSFPKTRRGVQTVSRVSINIVETLGLWRPHASEGADSEIGGFMNVDLRTRIPDSHASRVETASYRATGQVQRLTFTTLDELDELLNHAEVTRDAVILADKLFRLGRSPHRQGTTTSTCLTQARTLSTCEGSDG